MTAALVRLEGLHVSRGGGVAAFQLRVPSLTVARGARLALVGPSGCGKSTLLDVLACILAPDSVDRFDAGFSDGADVMVDVRRLLARRALGVLADLRGRHTGYVLQTGGLLPFLSVADNMHLPRRLLGLPDDGRLRWFAEQLGIERHLSKRPDQLSVGERQRVAIARALMHDPKLVLADEPTAALDPDASDTVMRLLVQLTHAFGAAVVVVSHDRQRVDRFGFTAITPTMTRPSQPGGVVSTFAGP